MALAERIRSRLRAVPARTMAIWLALIVVVFLTRHRWEAWVVERELPSMSSTSFQGVEASPDASRLLVRYRNEEKVLWDVRSGRLLAHFKASESPPFLDSGLRNGDLLAIAGYQKVPDRSHEEGEPKGGTDLPVHLVDARTGKVVRSFELRKRFALSPDGRRFLEIGSNGDVTIRDVQSGKLVMVIQTDTDLVEGAVCSLDGRWIVTQHDLRKQGSLLIWDAKTGRLAAQSDDVGSLRDMRFSRNLKNLFARSLGNEVCYLWDIRTGGLLARIECSPEARLEVCRDGSVLAVCDPGVAGIEVWDIDSARRLCRLDGPLDKHVSLSSDGRCLATRADRDLALYDLNTGARRLRIPGPAGDGDSWTIPQLTPDGQRVVSSGGQPIHIWSAETGELLAVLPDSWHFEVLGNDTIFSKVYGYNLIYRRLRPEWWWGVFWLWHFWVIAGLCVLLAASIWRDARALRKRS